MAQEAIQRLLKTMLERGASDLHLRSGSPAYLRIDGRLVPVDGARFNAEQLTSMIEDMLSNRQKTLFREKFEIDFSFSAPGIGRFRCNGYREKGRPAAVLRRVSSQIPDFEALGLPPSLKTLADQKWGLVLVTGPTGHGKSTTLAAMIEYINQTQACHIVTIEDPVEYVYEGKKSIISQRELGSDTLSFAEALKRALRQDPNVILLGEMRDLETVETALTAAETGHLVLSTLHTSGAVQAAARIVDLFPPHHQVQARVQLANVLRGAISQRLLPRSAGSGRVPACEVLINTGLVKKAILDNDSAELLGAMRQGAYYGMQTFHQSLLKLLNEGIVKLEDALEAASNPDELMMAVKGIQTGTDSTRIA